VSELFGRTDDVALALDHLRVYPNGFQLVVTISANPRNPATRMGGGVSTLTAYAAGAGAAAPPDVAARRPSALHLPPRLGVQFADGRSAGDRWRSPFEVPKDDAGIPTEPIMSFGGGGGGSGHFEWRHWVFPLPPPGPLDVFAEWSAVGIHESRITLRAEDVLDAAARAVVLWS
jgi:hypothetical protein